MKHTVISAFVALALAALPGLAQAQAAYTATTVNLRAGPAREYPIVAVLPPGLQISVQGCVPDYRWCDVIAGPNRGWLYGGNISYSYQNSYAPLPSWGPVVGITILGFVLDDYWHRHYWDRPWYPERHRWAVPPRPRPHVRPPPPPQFLPPSQTRPPPPAVGPGPRPHPPVPLGRQPPGAAPPPARPPGITPMPQPQPGPRVSGAGNQAPPRFQR